jgi:dephospho-CoA kinase
MVGPKKQEIWPKIKILKGNHCILSEGAAVHQKLGRILENKVVQKLKLEKMFSTKNGLLN